MVPTMSENGIIYSYDTDRQDMGEYGFQMGADERMYSLLHKTEYSLESVIN